MKFRLYVEKSRETGMYLVYCPELPGCSAVGEARERAVDEVRHRIRAYFKPERWVPPGAETEHVEL